ncbi:hypothetical protein OEV82_09090 [Caldibacillus thermolactis]|jgi:hypothetical protein|uniref:Fur-regulated basic protein FbpA n=1 Tax=Pallidibacillus thermolactis TaxID=251051 RepID=A0ABT2WFZ6_9BACI|nr:hypothetical protein [Pallidibacillus thermolactis]MCU9594610.1 hypothetical protein [Pallidibacillus thermolactis]
MGALFKAYNLVNEHKKAVLIDELVSLGVTGDGGVSLDNLEYSELKRMLVMEKVRRGL